MIRVHDLSPAQFGALARGYGGPGTIAALSAAQLSKHLLLIKFIAEAWVGDRAHRDTAVETLTRAQAAAPEAVAGLLTEPLVGAWAADCTRRLRGGLRANVPLDAECNHLSAIAAAAAARAGIEARLTVPAPEGRATVPGWGLTKIDGASTALVHVHDGHVTLEGGTPWLAPRTLTSVADNRSITVTLDDVDPYRGGHHVPPTGRLTDAELASWQSVFTEAWALMAEHAPDRADELAAGLRTLIPLRQVDTCSARSATIRDAFGAFGLTMPTRAPELAVTLVHEFQHSKLSGLLDVTRLSDPTSTELHFAPWRTDPRPVSGLLQGVYAFLGIADLWRRFLRSPALAHQAEREYAVVREQVRSGLTSLEASTALTEAGRRFTAGIRIAFDGMASDTLPLGVVEHAVEKLRGTHEGWQRRNAGLLQAETPSPST
jgi:HEXXH motif-containing protein